MIKFWLIIVLFTIISVWAFIYFVPWRNRRSIVITTLVLLIMLLLSYAYWGNYRGLWLEYQSKQRAELVEDFLQKNPSTDTIREKLVKHLQQHPKSAEGWYLLGRLYLSSKEADKASEAFAKANQLQSNDTKILLQYAYALAATNQHRFEGEPQQVLEQILQLEPNNPEAISLMAMSAYQQERYQTAIDYWQTLLRQDVGSEETKQALLQAIAKARGMMKD